MIRNLRIIPNDKRVGLNDTYQDELHLVIDENTFKKQEDAYLEKLTQALNPMIPTESLFFNPKSLSINFSEITQIKVEHYALNTTDMLILIHPL